MGYMKRLWPYKILNLVRQKEPRHYVNLDMPNGKRGHSRCRRGTIRLLLHQRASKNRTMTLIWKQIRMFLLGQTCRCHNTVRHLLQLISRNNTTVGSLEPNPLLLRGI